MTRTRKLASEIVKVLEEVWTEIQKRNPEVPPVHVTVGMGSEGNGRLRLGHFGRFRWHTDEDDPGTHELFVGGEGLKLGTVQVLNTLLHEAAHALAEARDIKDVSRQGRYHNQRFMEMAKELGLQPTGDTAGNCTVPEATQLEYMSVLGYLDVELDQWRDSEFQIDWDQLQEEGSGDRVKVIPVPPSGPRTKEVVSCACDRRIKIAKRTLEAGPITCGLCGTPFTRKLIEE